jgi:hypothetical protein
MEILSVANVVYLLSLSGLAFIDYREQRISLWCLFFLLCTYGDFKLLLIKNLFLDFLCVYGGILLSHQLFFFMKSSFLFGGGDEKMLALFSVVDSPERFSLTLIIAALFLWCKNLKHIFCHEQRGHKIPLAPYFSIGWIISGLLCHYYCVDGYFLL